MREACEGAVYRMSKRSNHLPTGSDGKGAEVASRDVVGLKDSFPPPESAGNSR